MSDAGDLLAGRYRLKQRVGSGAMGVVWQGMDERLQRQVAVKQLLPQPGLEPALAEQARQRAMREGRVAARLQHPHAIGVYDVVVDDGLPVLVMEYLPSRSLAELIAEGRLLAPEAVAKIGAQAASALAAAHDAGVVHRDIKPGNILITADGTAKITDFGISHATGDVALTQTGLVAGTPAYLAPEVARGHQPTAGSDIFSLGATLYAAVEGTPPFGTGGDNPLALLHKVAAGAFTPPRQAGPLTPVLASMLSPDPGTRPTAVQVGDALHAVAADHPLPETLVAPSPGATEPQPAGTLTDSPPERPPGTEATVPAAAAPTDQPASGRRRRLPLVLALLAFAVLAGIASFALFGPGDEQPAARAASMAPAEREQAVSEYYALLPDDAGKAWERLGPGLREQGRQNYLNRWSSVSTVDVVSAPEATGKNAVRVGVELTMPDGTKVTQFHRLGLVATKNTLLINDDEVLRSETSAPPAPAQPTQDDRNNQDDRENEQENRDSPTPSQEPSEDETTEPTTTTQPPEETTAEDTTEDLPTETDESNETG